jgi:biofilm PGA synthesis protein PgaD
MEESRSRVTEPRQLIIEAPSVLTLKDRIAEVGVTLFFWLLLLYLWQPVLSFLAWMFQGYVSYRHMFSLGGYRAVLDILQSYVSYIGLMTGLLFVWAFYNQLRFGGNERRQKIPDTSLLEHALYCNVNPEDVLRWRKYDQMVVTFGEDGYISGATEESLASFKQRQSI